MKKVVLFTIMVMCLFSCSPSKEDKAKALIKEYLKENLKDPSSYQPVSYSQLDSIFFPYIDTEEGKELFDLGGMTGKFHEKSHEFELASLEAKFKIEYEALQDSVEYYKKKSEEFEELFKENEENYKGEFIGWIMSHQYRAKNSFGALDLDGKDFYFDKELTKIVPAYGKTKK